MKYLVQVCQDLTACSTRVTRGPLNRVLSEYLFDTHEDAENEYRCLKSSFRFAGLAGQYVTYPREVDDSYIIHPYRCDTCGEGFSNDAFIDLPTGDHCSRVCFRNAFQRASNEYDEPYYEDEY